MVRAGGWRAATAAATLLFLLVAACGGDDDDSSSGDGVDRSDEDSGSTEADDSSASDDTSSDSTEAQTPEDAALQAYSDSNDYMERALGTNPPNPQDPGLSDYFSGSALSENIGLLLRVREDGEYYESTLDENPNVASATAEEVVLNDCVTESITSFDGVSGDEKDSSSNVYHWRVRVVSGESGWRVDEITPLEEPCTP